MRQEVTTLELRTRRDWRTWLQEHHDSESEIWLVFHKRRTGLPCISYNDAVEEALCFGWIDSLVKRLDDARYARKFTPRKPGSRWSTINRRRYEDLRARGLLAAPGLGRAPTDRTGDAPAPPPSGLPRDIETGLKADPRAWDHFQRLAPSYRRAYIGWIASAKRPETRERRLQEAISLLAAGKKLGLKQLELASDSNIGPEAPELVDYRLPSLLALADCRATDASTQPSTQPPKPSRHG